MGEQTTGVVPFDTAAVWAAGIAALLGLAVLLWRITRPLRRIIRLAENFAEDWHGVPARPGVEGRPGVMERLARIERGMGMVVHEIRPNGGASLRDAVHRVDCRTASLTGEEEPPAPAGHGASVGDLG